jgi:FlaA1/EpsC-like NDP-sugar epimerase
MKRVLVTGGSGFVGRHLIVRLLKTYPDIEITSLSRSEGVISKLLVECEGDSRVKIEMCDIRDHEGVSRALRGIDTVFHLAAMKRVDLSEDKSQEAATINVIGTINVINGFHGDTFISMSTDKAVEPVNCYGATKLVAEKLVMEQAHKARKGQRFMIVRSGNIEGSTGSVIDIWQHQIAEQNEITVTDPDMLRFYTGVESVVDLYLAVWECGENGKVYFTPHGEPTVLRDLISSALELYGNADTKVKITGLRHGERMYEKMYGPDEAKDVVAGEIIIQYCEQKAQR